MSYIFSIWTLRTYFQETFGSHYPHDIVCIIVKIMQQITIRDLKTKMKLEFQGIFISDGDLLDTFCNFKSDPCTELITSMLHYYPAYKPEIQAYYPQHALLSVAPTNEIDPSLSVDSKLCLLIDELQSEAALHDLDTILSEEIDAAFTEHYHRDITVVDITKI